jgi:OmpA-OmpF porin, OOP family
MENITDIDTTDNKTYTEQTKDLYLSPMIAGCHIPLNNVFFAQSTAELLPSSYPELNRIIEILRHYPDMHIELQGYTDSRGDAKKNIELSEQRAQVVKDYIFSHSDISKGRISSKGFGSARPVAPNNTEENRAKNRRVEFVITRM